MTQTATKMASTITFGIRFRSSGAYDKVALDEVTFRRSDHSNMNMNAVNMYTKDAVYSLLQKKTSDAPHVLIFHCEFSSERGPKMYRFLREQDRKLNKAHNPKLNYPEVYVLEGGYKAFCEKHENLCDPVSYKPMLHTDHASDLRHFRVKSKSWTAGEKQKRKPLKRSMSRFNLAF